MVKGYLVQLPCQDEEDEPMTLYSYDTNIYITRHNDGATVLEIGRCPLCNKAHDITILEE